MAEHLGEMRLPAWRSKRWQDFHTLHIWLGNHDEINCARSCDNWKPAWNNTVRRIPRLIYNASKLVKPGKLKSRLVLV